MSATKVVISSRFPAQLNDLGLADLLASQALPGARDHFTLAMTPFFTVTVANQSRLLT